MLYIKQVMDNTGNKRLYLGLFITIVGLFLLLYSFLIAVEEQKLNKYVDLEYLVENTDMTSTEKYYKYLDITDYLSNYVKKNKDLPIKNLSCKYMDYYYETTIDFYDLVDKKFSTDVSKTEVASAQLQNCFNTLKDYSTCPNASKYKEDIEQYLINDSKTEELYDYNSMGDVPADETLEQTDQVYEDALEQQYLD